MIAAQELLLVSLLAGCASAASGPHPSWLGDPIYARHARAIADYQRAHDHQVGELAWRCAELCRASDEACQSALELCTQGGPGPRCDEARHGCTWTRTMLPRACSYCVPPP